MTVCVHSCVGGHYSNNSQAEKAIVNSALVDRLRPCIQSN